MSAPTPPQPFSSPAHIRGMAGARRRAALVASGTALALCAGCPAPERHPPVAQPTARAVASEAPPRQTTALVDPFIGTGGHGHTYPGATVPFGMVQPSPDNGAHGWDQVSGYHYSQRSIVGFSQTHLSGTGIGDLCDVLLMPITTPVDPLQAAAIPAAGAFRSAFNHERETARPGYYAVHLDTHRVAVELTATERVAIHRYTFPESATAALVVDLAYAVQSDYPREAGITVASDRLLTGYRYSGGWAKDQRLHFALELSRPFTALQAVSDGQQTSRPTVTGTEVLALLHLPTRADEQVIAKVGLSYVSEAGALANLRAEASHWDFDGYRRAATERWEQALSPVHLHGGSRAHQRTFYTALYRTKLAPVLFSDVDGRYRGADGQVHAAQGYRKYTVFSLWDTFRAAHPLLTLLEPDRVTEMVRSMLGFYQQHGLLPVWSLVGNETNTMTGNHAVPVIADAYLKGIRGFDAELAYEASRKSMEQEARGLALYRQHGYIPSELEVESVTKTLEYAFDDWAVSELARALGKPAEARAYAQRARSYRNVFDGETRFMRGRTAGGDWVEPFDPLRSSHRVNTDYTEGNAWQHSFFVPHDVAGLIQLYGGDDAFIERLDQLFDQDSALTGTKVSPDISGMIGQYAHGNEPSHHIAYLYSYAGAPWKTQQRVRQIMALYDDTPAGLPGNEDCGQMGAWYVFSALGLYPVNPVGGVYVLGSPLFPRAELAVGDGRRFTILARDTSATNRYVQSARLNGRPYDKAYLRHADIVAGGRLELWMGPRPNETWGRAPGSRPPSMPAAE